jgi:hypothetical protein
MHYDRGWGHQQRSWKDESVLKDLLARVSPNTKLLEGNDKCAPGPRLLIRAKRLHRFGRATCFPQVCAFF